MNYRGADDTITCLRALRDELDYPAEARADLRRQRLRRRQRGADQGRGRRPRRWSRPAANLGFAGGCNLGREARRRARSSRFLNNDARPDPSWGSAAVAVLRAEPDASPRWPARCWTGTAQDIDFVDGGLTWFGMGYKRFAGQPIEAMRPAEHDAPRDVLFATGSAMFVRAERVRRARRLRRALLHVLRGRRPRLAAEPARLAGALRAGVARPTTATTPRCPQWTARTRPRAVPVGAQRLGRALQEPLRRDAGHARCRPRWRCRCAARPRAASIDATQLEITRRTDGPESTTSPSRAPRWPGCWPSTSSSSCSLAGQVPRGRAGRPRAHRRRPGSVACARRWSPRTRCRATSPRTTSWSRRFGIEEVFGSAAQGPGDHRRRDRRADGGPGDPRLAHRRRARGRARRPAGHRQPALATPPDAPFRVWSAATVATLAKHVAWADVVVLQGHALEMVPELKKPRLDKLVVCDIYDPMHLELLEQGKVGADDAARGRPRRRHPGAQRPARARRLLPVRVRAAAPLLARPPGRRSAGSRRPSTTPTRPSRSLLVGGALRPVRQAAGADRARDQRARWTASAALTRWCSGRAACTAGSTR